MINSNFNRLNANDFLSQVERIITAMTGNADFPAPWPSPVPALAQIQTDLTAYQTALTATQSGDRTRIAERDAARGTLSNDLFVLASYLQTVAPGDDSKLATTGFPLRLQPSRSRVANLPDAPANFELALGTVSGSVAVRASPVPSAGSYDVQLATADPTVEANWSAAGSFKNCSRITLQGLTPGKIYSVRLRALGSAGPGAWTMPASLMVV